MGKNVIPRKKGDSFQALFFWLQACKLLNNKLKVEKVSYEINSHDGFDDVAVYYSQSHLIDGKDIQSEYYQIKYHSNHKNGFTANSLISPEFIGTETKTILGRLLEIYLEDKINYSKSRYHIVNTWGLDYSDGFSELLRENGSIDTDKLLTGTIKSKYGKIRNEWSKFLDIPEDELIIILKSLYILAAKLTFEGLKAQLNNELNSVGLKTISIQERAAKYEELIDRLHEEGITDFNKASITDICIKDNLFEVNPEISDDNVNSYLSIRQQSEKHIYTQLNKSYFSLKYNSSRYVKRAIEDEIENWISLSTDVSSTAFLILASAGCGKTNTLANISIRQSASHVTFLIAAPLVNIGTMGLWESIISSFNFPDKHKISRDNVTRFLGEVIKNSNKRIIIIIDAINEHPEPTKFKNELLIFLEELREIGASAIISCRDYYWGLYDADWWLPFLKDKTSKIKINKYSLANYNTAEANEAFKIYFEQYNVSVVPKGNAIEQFRHPLLLRFFCETYGGQKLGDLLDVRLKSLFDSYWKNKFRSISERMISQGHIGLIDDLTQAFGDKIMDIALLMLMHNKRSIDKDQVKQMMDSTEVLPLLLGPYGRIMDEHIIMEELESYGYDNKVSVAFVFEEFMEYSMARGLFSKWNELSVEAICSEVKALTDKYNDFNQVFGVLLYAALMLKEMKNIALWPALISQGGRWQQVVIEAFKKLPEDQIDDGVFQAIVELLNVKNEDIQIEALELLKFGRLKRTPTDELTKAVGQLVAHKKLPVSRRAVVALANFPASFAVPFIEKAISKLRSRQDDEATIVKNALKSLAILNTKESIYLMCKIVGGFWRIYNQQEIADILKNKTTHIIPLLNDTDILVRVGATNILGFSSLQSVLTVLENKISNADYNVREYSKDELPTWTKFTGSSYGSKVVIKPDYEKREIERSIKKLKENIEVDDIDKTWRSKIDEIRKSGKFSELPYPIETLGSSFYSNRRLIMYILKSGLEIRSRKKWQITHPYQQILIRGTPSSLKGGMMSIDHATELAKLLGLDEINKNGYTFGVGLRYTDYWKEYIYRAWGLKPEVYGTYDYWD